VLTCIGDSNLHGTLSASITPEIVVQLVESLGLAPPRRAMRPLAMRTVSGELCPKRSHVASALHERMALKVHLVYMLVMIGTNDALCMHCGANSVTTKHICSMNQIGGARSSLQTLESNTRVILYHTHQASTRHIAING
jgi:hypothetical protein